MITTLLFALLGPAQADGAVCEALAGPALHYDHWERGGGGARPGPETVMSRETWRIGEDVLFTRQRTLAQIREIPSLDVEVASEPAPTPRGNLDWSWDMDSRVVESLGTESWMVRTTTYTADVTVWTRDESPIHATIAENRIELTMRCTYTQTFGRP